MNHKTIYLHIVKVFSVRCNLQKPFLQSFSQVHLLRTHFGCIGCVSLFVIAVLEFLSVSLICAFPHYALCTLNVSLGQMLAGSCAFIFPSLHPAHAGIAKALVKREVSRLQLRCGRRKKKNYHSISHDLWNELFSYRFLLNWVKAKVIFF